MDPATQAAEPVITDNPRESRFEIHLDGQRAGLAQYQMRGQVLSLTHTEVDD
jgi:hypothetical protein